jgi:hypothetical protein
MENTKINEFEENSEMPGRAPIVETNISKSRDGKWIIHKTVITDIKSVAYLDKVLKSQKGTIGKWQKNLLKPKQENLYSE